MPRLEIITPPAPEGPNEPAATWGTLIKVDGRELPDVRSLRLNFTLDDVVTAVAVLLVSEGFHYEAGADVHVTLEVQPGCHLVEETREDGSKVYRAEADV